MDQSITYEPGVATAPATLTASAAGWRLNLYLWLLLAVTNVVDFLGTRRAFQLGIEELNPLVAFAYAEFGIGAVAAMKIPFLLLLGCLLPYIRGWTRGLLAAACAVYLALTGAHIWYLSPLL